MVLHSELSGPDLHDVKGVESALSGQILSANGLGASFWIDPPFISSLGTATPISATYSTNLSIASLDTAVTVPFDSNVADANVSIDTSGTITFIKGGLYFVLMTLNMGRTATAGLSQMFARGVLGSSQLTRTYMLIDSTNASAYKTVTIPILRSFAASDVLKFQVIQDSAGGAAVANTALKAFDVTAVGWNDSTSAALTLTKLIGS
jgi:hypothetical protein